MSHRYGIYQSTATSCIFYKQDKDGHQSTFNLFLAPEAETEEKKAVFAFIDNEQLHEKNWFGTKKGLSPKEILDAFESWASDAPFVFDMEAQKSINDCLRSHLKAPEK